MKRVSSILFLLLFCATAGAGTCGKSTLAKSHRAMEDNLRLPLVEMHRSYLVGEKSDLLKKDKFTDEEKAQVLEDIRFMYKKISYMIPIVEQMLSKTDKLIAYMKKEGEDPAKTEKRRNNVITNATISFNAYKEVAELLNYVEWMGDSMSPAVVRSIMKLIGEQFAIADDSNMRGHYYTH